MRIVLKNYTCLVALTSMILLEDHYGQSPNNALPTEPVAIEQLQYEANQWILVPSYSWSFFNKGRDSWQKESIDLSYYLADRQLLLGTSINMMHRPPNGDDTMYSFYAEWNPFNEFELHGLYSWTPDANFLPTDRYALGMQYKLNPKLGLLFDVEQLKFGSYAPTWDDGITQIKPGISYWFTEKTFVTLRYTHGWVHDVSDYDYYSATVNIGDLPCDGQLTIGIAYGTDPDLDFGTGSPALSEAYTVNIFYKEPINPDLTIFVGLEYVYRLQANNDRELYQMWTPTIGLSWKF